MDEFVYIVLKNYINALEKLGYIPYNNIRKLLVLVFYKNYIYNDYRSIITEEDYSNIEKALNCLFGSTCLIPYPDYLKMGKLNLGEVSELAARIEALEQTLVMKAATTEEEDTSSDIVIEAE